MTTSEHSSSPEPKRLSRRAFLGILGGGAAITAEEVMRRKLFGKSTPSAETPPITTTITTPTSLQEATTPPTAPETSAQTTTPTTEAPTTTAEPKPTDVVEDKGEYKVLRNGGLLYEVESAPWFGGFELHIKSRGVTFGFAKPESSETESPQESLLRNLLWTFGNQHPEFIQPDGQVDIEAYKAYLEANDWMDPEVYVPENVSDESEAKEPPVVKSEPQKLDFKKPFIIGNDALSKIEGLTPDNANYYRPTVADGVLLAYGITPEGQLFYALYETGFNGIKPLTMKHPYGSFPIADKLGLILELTSRITYPEKNAQAQWKNPEAYLNDPFRVHPTGIIPPYPVLNIFDFVSVNDDKSLVTNKLFAPVNP